MSDPTQLSTLQSIADFVCAPDLRRQVYATWPTAEPLQFPTWPLSGRPAAPSQVSDTARHYNTATARYAFSTSLTPQPYRCGAVPSVLPG
jgi:hypothetical protein